MPAKGDWAMSSGESLGRAEKVALTKKARRIIAEKVSPQPPWAFPPEISSQECLKAIEHAGGVTIRHRGKDLHITEIVTRGTYWWSGDLRLPPGRFSNSGTPGAPLRCNVGTVRRSEHCGVNAGSECKVFARFLSKIAAELETLLQSAPHRIMNEGRLHRNL